MLLGSHCSEFADHYVCKFLIKIFHNHRFASKWPLAASQLCHLEASRDACSVGGASCSRRGRPGHRNTPLRVMASDPLRPGLAVFRVPSDTLGRYNRFLWPGSTDGPIPLTHAPPPTTVLYRSKMEDHPAVQAWPRAGPLSFLLFVHSLEHLAWGSHPDRLQRHHDEKQRSGPHSSGISTPVRSGLA